MIGWGRRSVLLAAAAVAVVQCPSVADVRSAAPVEPPSPMLPTAAMADMGWSLVECSEMVNGVGCSYQGVSSESASLLMQELTPVDSLDAVLELMVQTTCPRGARLDVGPRTDTFACTEEQPGIGWLLAVGFGNDSWLFIVTTLMDHEPSSEALAPLLALRDRQLEAAGGERQGGDQPEPAEASPLDQFLPDAVPEGWFPPAGATSDMDPLGGVSADEAAAVPPGTWEFLRRRSTTRVRAWTRDGGYILAVVVSEYPYELLAGLALGTFERPPHTRLDASAAESVEDLIAVDGRASAGSETPFVVEAFRRGQYEFQVVVSGPDLATSETLASEVAPLVADLAPTSEPTAPVWPPSTLVSLLRAVLLTTVVMVGVLLLRRLLGGRARRSPPLEEPRPVVADVSASAATLRRNGRVLAAGQLFACSVIVVALVADIGWWWPALVAAGLAIGVSATAVARRREQGRSTRAWSLTSWPTWLFGSAGAVLVVAGVAVAVRALNESVLLPSIAHLRLAERFTTTPERLSVVMALGGVGILVLGAILLRRSRAHARSAQARVRSDRDDAILYLRSFDDDRLSVPSVHSARRPFFELFGLRGRDPFEEGIAWELAGLGILTAVGRPGRSTASLGASRDHLPADGWQQSVARRMDTARAVVVTIGRTAGLTWELNALSARGHLGKCVLVVPPGTPEEVRSRWLATRAVIDEARGRRPFVEPVAVVGMLTVHIDESTGRVSATRADRVDEAAYRAAIAHAVHATVDSRAQETSAIPQPWPAPKPSTLVRRVASTVHRQRAIILSTQRQCGEQNQGASA